MATGASRKLLVALFAASYATTTSAEVVAQASEEYRAIPDWAKLPEGREWGAVTGVFPDPDGRHLWVPNK